MNDIEKMILGNRQNAPVPSKDMLLMELTSAVKQLIHMIHGQVPRYYFTGTDQDAEILRKFFNEQSAPGAVSKVDEKTAAVLATKLKKI